MGSDESKASFVLRSVAPNHWKRREPDAEVIAQGAGVLDFGIGQREDWWRGLWRSHVVVAIHVPYHSFSPRSSALSLDCRARLNWHSPQLNLLPSRSLAQY